MNPTNCYLCGYPAAGIGRIDCVRGRIVYAHPSCIEERKLDVTDHWMRAAVVVALLLVLTVAQ